MPRYNVKHPDTGKWRCFSTIIDDWITDWMDKKSYEEWRKQQYGVIDYLPAEQCNMMTLDEVEKIMQMYQETESESLSVLPNDCNILRASKISTKQT